MIDLHSHILPGVDDGAANLDDSLAIARAAVADGIATLAATPHVRSDYPTDADTMKRLVGEVRAALEREQIELELLTGGELALDRLEEIGTEGSAPFGLAGGPYLLVEFPYFGWPLGLEERLFRLAAAGHGVVLAHPERNADVQAAPQRLDAAVAAGALVQVTAASLDGRLGRSARRAAHELVERGLAHLIASDAHTADVRGVGMSDAAASLGDERLAAWMTREVPAAIVAGEPPPPRPPRPPRRRPRPRWRGWPARGD